MAIQRFAAATVLAAAFCLPVVPASAARLPEAADRPSAYDGSAETAHQSRGWGASRDDDGYSDYGSAAPRAPDDRYQDDARWAAPDDRQGDNYPAGRRALGLDRVAELCVSVVERERDRVNAVDGLARDANGWSVSGSLYDGSGFSCHIGTNGQLQDVHFGPERAPAPVSAAATLVRPQALPEPLAAGLAAPAVTPALSPAAPAQPDAAPVQNLAAAPPAPAAPDESAYRVAKLPPAPAMPQADGLAAARELRAQPAVQANLAAPAPAGPEAAAPPASAAPQAATDDDSAPLPPADTSEALPVDPDQSPIAAVPGQPRDDGRYSASQAPDFKQTV